MRQSPRQLQLIRGVGLLDAMIALAILAFGMLAMTRFQARTVAQTTEAQQRLVATQLGDELLSTVIVDVGNAACYTLPQAGACASATAKTRTEAWATRVGTALPGSVSTTSTIDAASGRLTVVINWTGKASTDARRLEAVTDVRP
ncbi:MAG: pilus assembly protein PilV [Rubrivivax sp.]|nr:pilus assembly protein PilV [Rubrivivax sp.]MDP3084171.1 pilus assembly protein PilV [Rubrivivax sp.]